MSLQQERTNEIRTCYRSEELRALFSHSLRLMRIEARCIPQIIRIQEARSSVCDLVGCMNNHIYGNDWFYRNWFHIGFCILLCSMYTL